MGTSGHKKSATALASAGRMLLSINGQFRFLAPLIALKGSFKLNFLQLRLFLRKPFVLAIRGKLVDRRSDRPRIGIIQILKRRRRRASSRCKSHAPHPHRPNSLQTFYDECDDFSAGAAGNPIIVEDRKSVV